MSLARLRHDHAWVVVGKAPECHAVGRPGLAIEHRESPRRLAVEDWDAIRISAETRSLRELAADFGVSHETVRSVRRDQ